MSKKFTTERLLIRIALILFSAVIAVAVFALLEKGRLTLYMEIPPDASFARILFDSDGIIETESISYDMERREMTAVFRSLRRGETTATVIWDRVDGSGFYSREMSMPMKVLTGGILFDGITYNFSGWEYLVLVLELVFCGTAAVLLSDYAGLRKGSGRYTYRSVRLLGFGLYFLILGLLRIPYIVSSLVSPESGGTMWVLLIGLSAAAQTFMIKTLPAVALFAAVMIVSNAVLLYREGFSIVNILGIAAGLFACAGAAAGYLLYYSHISFPFRNEILNIYAGLFVFFECNLAATVICAVDAGVHTPEYNKDYVVVLGCRVRPDGTLYPLIRGRVDRAVEFAEKQIELTGKRAVIVPSGGKGADEAIAEADAMAAYMIQRGVPESGILIENKSGTTRENMRFSRALIEERGTGGAVAYSTSDYHVFRGGILAESEGWEIDGMGSRTRWYFWPNAFFREFIGLIADSWFSQLVTAAIIVTVSYALTVVL